MSGTDLPSLSHQELLNYFGFSSDSFPPHKQEWIISTLAQLGSTLRSICLKTVEQNTPPTSSLFQLSSTHLHSSIDLLTNYLSLSSFSSPLLYVVPANQPIISFEDLKSKPNSLEKQLQSEPAPFLDAVLSPQPKASQPDTFSPDELLSLLSHG